MKLTWEEYKDDPLAFAEDFFEDLRSEVAAEESLPFDVAPIEFGVRVEAP